MHELPLFMGGPKGGPLLLPTQPFSNNRVTPGSSHEALRLHPFGVIRVHYIRGPTTTLPRFSFDNGLVPFVQFPIWVNPS